MVAANPQLGFKQHLMTKAIKSGEARGVLIKVRQSYKLNPAKAKPWAKAVPRASPVISPPSTGRKHGGGIPTGTPWRGGSAAGSRSDPVAL